MRFITRPLPAVWPTGARTPEWDRRNSPFRASWDATMRLLQFELDQLEAAEPVVLEAGYRAHEIRLDGAPRKGVRPSDPAVVVSFTSRFGPLRYGCDTYHEHAANLRGIALALEALRAVDRYGVTKRGEQYQGWSALPPAAEPGMSREEAEAFIRHHGTPERDDDDYVREIAQIPLSRFYRRAAQRLHPDVGGDSALMSKLNQAARVVGL